MPSAVAPVATSSSRMVNESRPKVYFKKKPTDEWKEDKTLICIGHNPTKGSKIGSAQFVTLMFDNTSSSDDWDKANKAMRYNAAAYYNVDMTNRYKTPYLVKVTNFQSGNETAVWYGYISTVVQDFEKERVAITGLTYEGLLDQQPIIGGWYVALDGVVDYFLDYKPVYNPDGTGNKSTVALSPTPSTYIPYGIDESLLVKTGVAENLWTVGDMIDQIWSRCVNDLYRTEHVQWNPWGWGKLLYTKTTSLSMSSSVKTLLENSPPLGGYSLHGKTIWEALVELVEGIDGLTISGLVDTESGDRYGSPYLSIINLRESEDGD